MLYSPMKTKKSVSEPTLTRLTRTIFFFCGFYILSIIIFDSGNLLTHEAVINRWQLVSSLLVINTITWFVAARQFKSMNIHTLMTYSLTLLLIVFAGLSTYWERGMASTSTIFFILPLLVIATLKNRHALLATATLSAATYGLATVRYFNDYFNEGYRIQLWGSILLYIGTIFVSVWLIMIIAGLRHDST